MTATVNSNGNWGNCHTPETSEITCHHQVITVRNDKSCVFELIEIAGLVYA
jgi:hypothetical protein